VTNSTQNPIYPRENVLNFQRLQDAVYRDIQRGIAIDDTPHVRDTVCLVTTILHWTVHIVRDMVR